MCLNVNMLRGSLFQSSELCHYSVECVLICVGNCATSVAIVDKASTTDTAHAVIECSNAGYCNYDSGKCECFNGYEGSTCQRRTCINDCSGTTLHTHNNTVAFSTEPKVCSFVYQNVFLCSINNCVSFVANASSMCVIEGYYIFLLCSLCVSMKLSDFRYNYPHSYVLFEIFSGRGVCETMEYLALKAGVDTTPGVGGDGVGPVYTNWEKDLFHGCVCEMGYTGPDCSQGTCGRKRQEITHHQTFFLLF